jgi:lysophospholipase L1-like esterase
MKKLFTILSFVLLMAISCTRFDDSAIWEELLNHKERIEKLEAECNRLNANINSLQTILEALQTNDYVTDIVKIMEDSVEIGYSITFAKSGTVTIYHGTNGSAPKVGIQKAADGQYYWTSDGEWLTDENGAKIPAAYADGGDGKYITPLFRVAEGVWYVSYDNGSSWMQIVEDEDDEEVPLFKEVTYDKEYVYLTLADGSVIKIPIDTSSYTDVPQINNSYIRPKAKDEPIKILCFGSSWFLNTWWYLNKITGNLGINAEIHGYYVGHSCFDEWISLYNNDLSPFAGSESSRGSYRYVSVNGANYTSKRRVSGGEFGDQEFRDAWYEDLISEDWDIIAFQQGAHQAPKWKYWESGPELVSIIRRHCGPNTMIAFNSTWTPSVTSSSLPNDTDGLCSKTLEGQKLWQTMNFDNCKRFMNITGISNVSPNGAMMYTLRRDPKMNIDGDDLCYDGLHPNHGLPMFALASVFYETFIAPFYGISIKECTWLPSTSDKKGPFNNSVFRPVTEAQRDRIYEYVRLSLSNRFGFNEPYPYVEDESEWTKIEGVEIYNTMPQESGYVASASGLVTEYSGYDWSKYDVRVTCRYGGNAAMYAGCFWGENDTYLGGFWKSTGTAKVFNQVILTDEDLPEGVSWSDVVKIGLSSQEDSSYGFRYTTLEVRPKDPSIILQEWFRGKNLCVFGDSITAGVGTTSPYYFSQMLCDNLEFGQLTRLGNSGYAFSHGINDYGYTILEKVETSLAKVLDKCDVLLICFGVNDWTWGRNIDGDRAIGSMSDNTKYTICGAVNLFCQKLQTIFADYPEVKIYFSTPTPTKNAPISGGNPSGKSWDQSKRNYNGNTLRDICEAIATVANSYGYQVLDLNQYFLDEMAAGLDMDTLFPDGLHPNESGNEKIALALEKLLLQ